SPSRRLRNRLGSVGVLVHRYYAPTHFGTVVEVAERGIDERADRLVDIADRDRAFEHRQITLPNIQPLRLAADEHRDGLRPSIGLFCRLNSSVSCRLGRLGVVAGANGSIRL